MVCDLDVVVEERLGVGNKANEAHKEVEFGVHES